MTTTIICRWSIGRCRARSGAAATVSRDRGHWLSTNCSSETMGKASGGAPCPLAGKRTASTCQLRSLQMISDCPLSLLNAISQHPAAQPSEGRNPQAWHCQRRRLTSGRSVDAVEHTAQKRAQWSPCAEAMPDVHAACTRRGIRHREWHRWLRSERAPLETQILKNPWQLSQRLDRRASAHCQSGD